MTPPPRTHLGRQVAILAVVVTLLSTWVVAFLAYRAETNAGIRGVEGRLSAIAAAMPEVVPADVQHRIIDGHVTPDEYRALVTRLSALAADAGVYYIYTCTQRGDQILMTVSSATSKELAEGAWSKPLDLYKLPPPELRETFRDGKPRFASYTDEFGSFRSIFVPVPGSSPAIVSGADVRLDDLRAMARTNLISFLGIGTLVSLAVGWLGVRAGHRLAAPVQRLTSHVRTFTDRDFSNDQESTAELTALAAHDRAETGQLAEAFLTMRGALAEHIERLKTVTAERERAESQLRIAREIQQGLLPSRPPKLAGFDIAGWSQPADETGGDFFDWVNAKDGTLFLAVADATGHGLGPAMMAAACRAYARATLLMPGPLLPLLERLNKLVCADSRDGNFVTFFAARLDATASSLEILSAGHGPGLHYTAATGEVRELATHGLPLGVADTVPHEAATDLPLAPGDVVLITSDGFFEWRNAAGEQFGIPRLSASFRAAIDLPADQIIAAIRTTLFDFAAGTKQPDDMTAVVIRRL